MAFPYPSHGDQQVAAPSEERCPCKLGRLVIIWLMNQEWFIDIRSTFYSP